MSRTDLYIVDAFAEGPFGGNPAAVCLPDREPDAGWMQRVAAEMNLSETAFLLPRGPGEWNLRWFTPRVEVDLCGHATLASAHTLWRERGVAAEALTFHTRGGPLIAAPEDGAIRLDFPARPPTAVETDPALAEALGVTPQWMGRAGDDLLVVVAHAQAVRALDPDLAKLATHEARGVMVTAPGDRPEYDFVSRFFAPAVGIPEDPVTGSAHCALGPYWGARLGKDRLRAYQASERGGSVSVRLQGERVHLLGGAVTVLEGRLRA